MDDLERLYEKRITEYKTQIEQLIKQNQGLDQKCASFDEKNHNMKFQLEEAGREAFKLKEEIESLRIQTGIREKEVMRNHEERLKDATQKFSDTLNELRRSYEEKIEEKSKNAKRKLKETESDLIRNHTDREEAFK